LLSLVGDVTFEVLFGELIVIFFFCFWAVAPMVGGFNLGESPLGGLAGMLGDLMVR